MALRLRKDIKKSSYYVWFLGAKESQGLRGDEYILPVVRHLIERERDIEPFKVTLQVSHKGLKIIQNIITTNTKHSKPKNETIKHFIPHNTITCVLQHEDIVACILLLFNPVTKCPLHVHAYRCDSLETATLLKSQLQILIERPENQKKFTELEQRLKLKSNPQTKVLKAKKFDSSLGSSDTGTTTSSARESESSDEQHRFNHETRIANLYDSLAAELRQKLGKNDPILLPPRDYDTVHRQKGNLTGIELRRSLNSNIVGLNMKNQQTNGAIIESGVANGASGGGRRGGLESSGGSSGIGSDHAPSPDGKEDVSITHDSGVNRFSNPVDNQSSSDEDWNAEPMESTLYLMHGTAAPSEPLARMRNEHIEHDSHRKLQREVPKAATRYAPVEYNDKRSSKYIENEPIRYQEQNKTKYQQKPNASPKQKYFGEMNYSRHEQPSPLPDNSYKTLGKSDKNGSKYIESSPKINDRYHSSGQKSKHPEEDHRYISDRYYDSKKIEEYVEDPSARYYDDSSPIASRRRAESRQRSPSPKEKDIIDNQVSPKDRFKDAKEKFLSLEKQRLEEQERLAALRRATQQEKPISPINNARVTGYSSRNWTVDDEEHDYFENDNKRDSKSYSKRHETEKQKYDKEVQSRYSDGNDNRYYQVDERYADDNRYDYKDNDKIKYFNRYNEQTSDLRYKQQMDNRYVADNRYNRRQPVSNHPKPAPRNSLPPQQTEPYEFENHVPLERYRNVDHHVDPKRRSMYNLIEDEHKRTSNEIAKELKRRSYLENSERYFNEPADHRYYSREKPSNGYGEISEHERYPGLDRDDYRLSKSSLDLDKMGRKSNQSNGVPQQRSMMTKSTLELDRTEGYDPKYMKNQQIISNQQQQPKMPTKSPIPNAVGYRHSYAEPKLRIERMGGKKLFPDMLHRTNSSVSNSGRVGIASIHPY